MWYNYKILKPRKGAQEMMKHSIPCLHETDQVKDSSTVVADYHPLTRTEFNRLIELVSQEKGALTLASIQVRLGQAIRGSVCPHEIDGPVAEKHATLDQAFVDFCHGTGSASAIWDIIATS